MYSTEELISILDTTINRSVEIQSACSPLRSPGEENPEWEAIHKFNVINSQTALEGYWQTAAADHARDMDWNNHGIWFIKRFSSTECYSNPLKVVDTFL